LLSNGNSTAYFNGQLDDIAIWNRPLSSLEINSVYNSSITSQVETLKGSYLVYPNPFTNIITIKADDIIYATNIQLVDQLGRTETIYNYNQHSNIAILYFQRLDEGLYFLKITCKDGTLKTIKIINKD